MTRLDAHIAGAIRRGGGELLDFIDEIAFSSISGRSSARNGSTVTTRLAAQEYGNDMRMISAARHVMLWPHPSPDGIDYARPNSDALTT